MALKFDFLTKEILVKIGVKFLGVFRTFFLLFSFGITNVLDDFYYSNSIVGLILLVNILFETTYSRHINKNKNNLSYIKKFHQKLNILVLILALLILTLSFVFIKNVSIIYHLIVLSLWAIVNINSYFFLLIFRFLSKHRKVLLYYFLFAFFNLILILVFIKTRVFSTEYLFISISLSILISELLTYLIVFYKFSVKVFLFQSVSHSRIYFSRDIKKIFKVLLILILVSLIDVSDKAFLSYLGEGNITYYTYGLYAPLMIRQALDIKSNFFAQINQLNTREEINKIFFATTKKVMFFFLIAVGFLVITLECFKEVILSLRFFTFESFDLMRNIVYLGIVITPFYIIWDLFYRFYYRRDMINKLLIITTFGFIVNLILNYSFCIVFSLDLYGIILSTLLVFIFYNVISYKVFFKRPYF